MLSIGLLAIIAGIVVLVTYAIKYTYYRVNSIRCKAKVIGVKYRDVEDIYLNTIIYLDDEEIECELNIKDKKQEDNDLIGKEYEVFYNEKRNEVYQIGKLLELRKGGLITLVSGVIFTVVLSIIIIIYVLLEH